MTTRLGKRQSIIQNKRKQTSFRDFLLDIASWCPLKFYKNQGYISRYPTTARSHKLTDIASYENIRNDMNGIQYSGDFFSDLKRLIDISTLPAMIHGRGTQGCQYADAVFSSNTVYLSSTVVSDCSHVFYSLSVKQSCHHVYNSMMVRDNCHNIYQSTGVIRSSNIFYSFHIENCFDLWLSVDCIGCQHCINCSGLRNQSYVVDNIAVGKQAFLEAKKVLLKNNTELGSRYMCLGTEHAITFQCEDIENVHLGYRIKTGRNTLLVGGHQGDENIYDMCVGGGLLTKHVYGCMAGGPAEHMYCCIDCDSSSHHYYSYNSEDSSFCLGCVGLKNKQYCILNKQYSKEERYSLADRIFEEINNKGKLGDSFPHLWNPYYINDTPAGMLLDIDKEEAESLGFLWRNNNLDRQGESINISKLSDYESRDEHGNWNISERIENQQIWDKKNGVYKILAHERNFLTKHKLALPRCHWLQRMQDGLRAVHDINADK